MAKATRLTRLVEEIRACRHCAEHLPHEPRPVLQAAASARVGIFGQAPGTRVHASGRPFTDPSGVRLRDWLGMSEDVFYDARRVAIVPMGFCFPGLDAKGGDLPPRRECAALWRARLMALLPKLEVCVLVGAYAQRWHLGARAKPSLTETVAAWRDYAPEYFPTPHPSWRNNAWLKRNRWFEAELLPALRARVAAALR
ncbi:uracil-DNA glycosylase family protein [Amphiplicatus metriothermophilus]|uniref:Uracil-DNA glycosylase n=1 Tax=Amphiplicatus metriothermophilus TaxID=1519374 RepID=A0A239PQ37_9PROT|nr:uracil-DNA glycosylase family protein [Amphiplicatus metriothermophilus]MBB5518680.1 uracil-DNA glycosylase [Amphiplicatus metriothermophilus]SNT72163.1 Uracil-DNA glycosylase [Amphiplicatus metriothermophilus]